MLLFSSRFQKPSLLLYSLMLLQFFRLVSSFYSRHWFRYRSACSILMIIPLTRMLLLITVSVVTFVVAGFSTAPLYHNVRAAVVSM